MEITQKHPLVKRFSLLQALYWAFIASFCTYIVAMLNDRQVKVEVIGLLSAFMTMGGCFGQFIVSYFCDLFKTFKKTFIVCILILQASCLCLYFTTNTVLLYIISFVIGFTKMPLSAVMDTWFMTLVTNDARIFGKTRSLGSFAFAVMTLIFGFLLVQFGYVIMPILSTLIMCALLYFCSITQDVQVQVKEKKNALSLKQVFLSLSPMLLVLFFASTLLGSANNAAYNMLPIMLGTLGGTTAHQGLTYFMNAGMEVPAMRFHWEKFGLKPPMLLVIASILYILSTFLIAYSTAVWQIILLMALNGFAFGMQLPARRKMVSSMASTSLQTTMHGISDMLYFGIGPIVSNAICGYLMAFKGMKIMLLFCCLLEVFAFVLFMYLYVKDKKTAVQN